MRCNHFFFCAVAALMALAMQAAGKMPVDYVNPYMGNISHMLQPTYPTVHLPYGMLRVYPQRGSFVDSEIHGLPLMLVNHREVFSMNLSATQRSGNELEKVITTDYDNEQITPYYYRADIEQQRVAVEFAPAERSAMYRFRFVEPSPGYVIVNASNGEISVTSREVAGFQHTWGGVKVYIYGLSSEAADECGILKGKSMDGQLRSAKGDDACAVMKFSKAKTVNFKYGISYISVEQAKANLLKEIGGSSFEQVKSAARDAWNRELGKIMVDGGSDDDKAVFYTSLYRVCERPVKISEDGRYFNPVTRQVAPCSHDVYTDDWLWDTYRAAHPLRLMLSPDVESDILNSYLDLAREGKQWLPTFPAITGDSHRMNCNHGIAIFLDAWAKGMRSFSLEEAYNFGRNAIEKKTLAPWKDDKAGALNAFYEAHGYIPALHPGEKETYPDVHGWEKRQAVAVTLGTSYDQWCLSEMARLLGKGDEAKRYLSASYNYRNLYNHETAFFHPKDSAGRFIEPFDYKFSGGIGARDYYDENNGWTYRWDVQHNVADLVSLMGGVDNFSRNLDRTFTEWLGRSKYEFYAVLPDQTGNVGQFTMGNEPSLHIPYLYNYAGKPWKTQKRVRDLIHQWFRNDVMGVPGDEDGGGMSAFVVFSMMGFYPVTPGMACYNIGSPFFSSITIALPGGKTLNIQANGCSADNKYIQRATINGKAWNKPWFSHADIADGATIVMDMADRYDAKWGTATHMAPPSAMPYPGE
ncbi:MAG: GH92 family glycosyl hydrolase [Bacteroidales bacterium]|nr:GH92 family glycosyl hydrolase [Bacteroidales bacterium]